MSEPYIEHYRGLAQPLVGVLYACRYFFMFALVACCRKLLLRRDDARRLLWLAFWFLLFNSLVGVLEFFQPAIHDYFARIKGAYGEDFSFVYRGITPLLNVYDAAFSVPILMFLASVLLYREHPFWFYCALAACLLVQAMLGTRAGIVTLALYLGFFYLLVARNSLVVLRNFLVILVLLSGTGWVLYQYHPHFKIIVDSMIHLTDSVGSIDQHLVLFWSALNLIWEHPMGVGVGRTNFAAWGNQSFYNPESFLLSLAIDCGVYTALFFVLYHLKFVQRLRQELPDRVLVASVAALVLALVMVSLVNMQIFYSSFVSVFVPVTLYAIRCQCHAQQQT